MANERQAWPEDSTATSCISITAPIGHEKMSAKAVWWGVEATQEPQQISLGRERSQVTVVLRVRLQFKVAYAPGEHALALQLNGQGDSLAAPTKKSVVVAIEAFMVSLVSFLVALAVSPSALHTFLGHRGALAHFPPSTRFIHNGNPLKTTVGNYELIL